MKTTKKFWALVLAIVMALALTVPASAATGDLLDAAETTIEATNLTAGDSIGYIQLIEWDTTNSGWKLTANGTATGLSLDALINGITNEQAGTIATALKDVATTAMTVSGTTATATVQPGLYFLRAVPGENNKDTVYNPAFVSADYYEGGNTIDLSTAYSETTVLKKTTNTFDKEVVGDNKYVSTKPGDVIPYQITTKIPTYGAAYTDPTFTITDSLSAGLQLDGKITVSYDGKTAEATTSAVSNDDLTITPNTAEAGGFTVDFKDAYLLKADRGEVEVTITYFAKVTTNAAANVTPMDNKADLVFSHTPTQTDTKEDITRHYTYSIDGNLLGGGTDKTKELIKTGTDKNGQPITTETTYYNNRKASPLDGASFTLYKENGTTVVATSNSADGGYINFSGLEAGTYKLVETSAPTGYVKDSRTFTVTITPSYDDTITDLLKSYTITITAEATADQPAYSGGATFTMANNGEETGDTEPVVTSSGAGTDTSFINNTQGKELPSTGGIGTKIFYTMGAVLVIGAGVVLVSRKRAGE